MRNPQSILETNRLFETQKRIEVTVLERIHTNRIKTMTRIFFPLDLFNSTSELILSGLIVGRSKLKIVCCTEDGVLIAVSEDKRKQILSMVFKKTSNNYYT